MRLSSISSNSNLFSLFDLTKAVEFLAKQKSGNSNSEIRNDDDGNTKSFSNQNELKDFVRIISSEFSGMVFDQGKSFDYLPEKLHNCGAILSLEKNQESVDPLALPEINANWGVTSIKNNYGVAKLQVYYDLDEQYIQNKRQFLAEIYDFCKYEHIDLVLEPIFYGNSDLDKIIFSLKELSRYADMFLLDYLDNPLTMVTITAEIDKPWIYKENNAGYEEFKQNLRTCLDSGAKGFCASSPFVSGVMINQEIIRDRILETTRILNESLPTETTLTDK